MSRSIPVATLTDPRHVGQLYELTGPRLLGFAEAIGEIAKATGRAIRCVPISSQQFRAELTEQAGPELAELLTHVMAETLDGRNAWLGDGVQKPWAARRAILSTTREPWPRPEYGADDPGEQGRCRGRRCGGVLRRLSRGMSRGLVEPDASRFTAPRPYADR